MAKPVVAGADMVAPDGYELSVLYHGTAADQYPKRSRWEAPQDAVMKQLKPYATLIQAPEG